MERVNAKPHRRDRRTHLAVTRNRGGVVLVVDDYEDARDIFCTFLQFAGYEVLAAADGQDALDVARRQRPDLILLDLKMPRMDGETFRREQLADATLSAIRVRVLSGSSDGRNRAATPQSTTSEANRFGHVARRGRAPSAPVTVGRAARHPHRR